MPVVSAAQTVVGVRSIVVPVASLVIVAITAAIHRVKLLMM